MPNGTDPVYRLGYFTETRHGCEGWFKWFPLKDESTHIRCDFGTGANDPFFIAHNEAAGEYFIGDLAYSANWEMDFKSDQEWPAGSGRQELERDANLWFKIGRWASSPLRTIAAGESLPTFPHIWARFKGILTRRCKPCTITSAPRWLLSAGSIAPTLSSTQCPETKVTSPSLWATRPG